jgi:hypothetical protein
MTSSVIIAAPLLIAAIVMAVRFVGCGLPTNGLLANSSYSGTVSGTAGLVSFWQLNEPSGTTAVDSADGNNGTYEGGVTLHVGGLVSSDASDSNNFAAQFDGHSGYVKVPFAGNLNPPQFTVEALVQPSVIDANTHVIVSSDTGYQVALNANSFQASVGHSGNFQPPVVVNAGAQTGQQYYVAMTYDGATLQLYVNPDASDGFPFFLSNENTGNKCYNSAAVAYTPATSNELRIGATADGGPGEFFNGAIQDVAVYNRALSFEEIVQHYWIFATGYSVSVGGPGGGAVGGLAGTGTLQATKVGFPPNAPTATLYGAGSHLYTIPYWCTYIDLFLLGAGGGGSVSLAGGNGGQGGSWQAKTLQRGLGIPWTTATISITVGSGGSGGSVVAAPASGGNTTATVTGATIAPASGGVGGANPNPDGASPNPVSQTLNGTTETGGPAQTTLGGAGNPPGGGGAGGLLAGGAGADGAAWIVARQT